MIDHLVCTPPIVFEAVHLSTHLKQLRQGDIVLVGRLRTFDAGAAEAKPRIDHVQRGGLALAEGQLLQAQVLIGLGDAAVQQHELLARGFQLVPGLAHT
ncbi:hypothetical protein D3C78_1691370 [compost metagenome]